MPTYRLLPNLFTKDVWRMFTKLVKPPPYAFDFCVLTKPKMVLSLSKQAKPIIRLRYFVIAFARKCLKYFSLFICFRPLIVFLHASFYSKVYFVKDFTVYFQSFCFQLYNVHAHLDFNAPSKIQILNLHK